MKSVEGVCVPCTFLDKTSPRVTERDVVPFCIKRDTADYCLKVKSNVLLSPAPTVTFWLLVPNFSCHAVIV